MPANLRALPTPARKTRNAKSPAKALGVVSQIRTAFRSANRTAAFIGLVFGGFIPLATYTLAHYEVDPQRALWLQPCAAIVAGGLLVSAITVWQWSRRAFESAFKATGFVLLLEGILTLSQIQWLALTAAGLLITINGVATGCALSRE